MKPRADAAGKRATAGAAPPAAARHRRRRGTGSGTLVVAPRAGGAFHARRFPAVPAVSSFTQYKNMLFTGAGTLGSRVLGLARDHLVARLLGGGLVADAFLFAFQVPNLFRRLLGEGALTAAAVPVMSKENERGGRAAAFAFLNTVLTRAALLMFALTAVAMLVAWLLSGADFLEDRHRLAAWLTVVSMPYMPLICLAALFTAGLNIFGRFGITALSAVWLNLAMIAALAAGGLFLAENPVQLAALLCCGTLVGGLLQLFIPLLALRREGWRAAFAPRRTPAWNELRALFLPALAGAGIQQINFFVSRFLALNLDECSLSVYYYANRIVELPVGLFAITVSTVIFPALARHAAAGDTRELGKSYAHGMRLIFAVNIPAAAGLLVLAEPVVRAIFEYGEFRAAETAATVPVLLLFTLAMPFYGAIALTGRALNAVSETRVQARIAGWLFAANLVLAPAAAALWGVNGLAGTSLLLTLVQFVCFQRALLRRDAAFKRQPLLLPLLQTLVAAAAMAVAARVLWLGAERFALGGARPEWLPQSIALPVVLLAIIAVAAALYFALLSLVRFPETGLLRAAVVRRFSRTGSARHATTVNAKKEEEHP
ncbi:MAG: murein biosynthesis integral membrane protein MurJ [Puniceicoccales bacterium]|nr:murein biosynthesis integral membrane protein MurJ [Puniceicoccales bacterium]